ncbi:hypothetical protein [Sphingobium sp. CCH11-B1]|jgi:hypothetical protein|uniref:hypothetical protein n=1 Tax=Sphingobium sp. CCH11-B1 TaxID=1768781 RepID=UPI00082FCAC3|nr:hypothetical protein [Sphingobium sp. CCH11-B1]
MQMVHAGSGQDREQHCKSQGSQMGTCVKEHAFPPLYMPFGTGSAQISGLRVGAAMIQINLG